MDSQVFGVLYAGLLVVGLSLWGFFLVGISKHLKTSLDTFEAMNRLNAEINGRVSERVKIVNRGMVDPSQSISNLPEPAPGMLHSYGSDILVEEQPPVTTTRIKDEADEILREMNRFRDPRNEFDKRDNWGDGIEEG